MGATVNLRKMVGAHMGANLEVIYFLFELNYCIKDGPAYARWNCYAVGSVEQVMPTICMDASAYEGGSAQTQEGMVKPEDAIESWYQALANPFQMPDFEIEVALDPHGKAMAPNQQPLVDQPFHGEQMVGKAVVSLFRHGHLLSKVYGCETGQIFPSKMFGTYENLRRIVATGSDTPADLLGYQPEWISPAALNIPHTKYASFSDGYTRFLLRRQADGTFVRAGTAPEVIVETVNGLCAAELRAPGTLVHALKTVRQEIAAGEADLLSDETVVKLVVDAESTPSDADQKGIASIAQAVGRSVEGLRATIKELRGITDGLWFATRSKRNVWMLPGM